MRFYIYGDNSRKNIFNSKRVFKKNKYSVILISFDKAVELYDRYVSEKRFKNIYLIMDINNSQKAIKQYDLDDTSMNWMLISASCNYGEICHTSDCSWATKNNSTNNSTVDFKSNRSMVKTYLSNKLDINIRFINNNIEYNRIISADSLTEFEDDQKFIDDPKARRPKGKFVVDYRRYKRSPQINRVPNVSNVVSNAPDSGNSMTEEFMRETLIKQKMYPSDQPIYKLSDEAKESIQKSVDNCNNNVSFDELNKIVERKKGIEIPSFLLKPNYAKMKTR